MHGCERPSGAERSGLPCEGSAYRLARLLVAGVYAGTGEPAAGETSPAESELRRAAVATANRLLRPGPAPQPDAGPLRELEQLQHWIETCRDQGRLSEDLASSLQCVRSRLARALER